MKHVRTRFAPSPTGFLHIGSLRTALYSYVLAKHYEGDFILRIEDTDQKREVEGAVDSLIEVLKKFSLFWDEGPDIGGPYEPYVQSERLEKYSAAAKKLIEKGYAFYCQCKAKNAKDEGYSSEVRDPCREKNLDSGAVKLKVPDNRKITYHDYVHKKDITWDTNTVYDATLLKTDGFPTYHLAVVVDDLDMKITHVLRGHDWLPSTPIHLLVYEFLNETPPNIGHLTDILSSETGKKLSKRRDSVFVEEFLKEGYLPQALLNFIMLLGWASKNNKEIFTLDELVKEFDPDGFQSANPTFFKNKLDWMNGQYIMNTDENKLTKLIYDFFEGKYQKKFIKKVLPLVQTRIKTLKEFDQMAEFFIKTPNVDVGLLGEKAKEHLSDATSSLKEIKDWNLENINTQLMSVVKKKDYHTGKFFMNFRIAITGNKFTPPINDSVEILGKQETLARLESVLDKLK